jgi:hypothetical protein
VLIFRDITARRKADEELRRSEEQVRSMVNTVIDGIITIEPIDFLFLPAGRRNCPQVTLSGGSNHVAAFAWNRQTKRLDVMQVQSLPIKYPWGSRTTIHLLGRASPASGMTNSGNPYVLCSMAHHLGDRQQA